MTFVWHFLNLMLQGFDVFYSSRDKAGEYRVGHKSHWLNSKQLLSATVVSSLKMQLLSSKSCVCNCASPLIVSALYLGSCNCGRHHPLCLQNHTAQSQLLLTLIRPHWAEPPCPRSGLHLVTANSRVDKLSPMKKICLSFESFQTVELRRCSQLISNALRRVTGISYMQF